MTVQKMKEKLEPLPVNQNPSGLIPKGRSVLIRPYQVQRPNSLIQLPPSVTARQQMIEDRGIVIAIGPACWDDEKEPRAEVGDHVMISKYSGYMVEGPLDQVHYRVINDQDIYVVIETVES